MARFKKIKQLSPWRKLSLLTWEKPSDPSVYGKMEIDARPCLKFVEDLNKKHPEAKITLTHVVGKAMGLTIARYPNINGIVRGRSLYLRDSVDLFLQVAVPNTEASHKELLSGAKIENIDQKSIPEIASSLQTQATDIRSDNDRLFKKSFSLANLIPQWLLLPIVRLHEKLVYDWDVHLPSLGIIADPFGSAMLTSVGSLNVPGGYPPLVPFSRCPLLMCLGQIETKPWVIDNNVVPCPIMTLFITFDHRFLDGLMASRMHKFLKDLLEHPEKML